MKNIFTISLCIFAILFLEDCSGNAVKKPVQICRTRHPLTFNPQPGKILISSARSFLMM